ncbi:MAG: sigma-70 family RNA polymerase sigma factor [Acetobacteraceae bacterium]|nr:sigma-70 family RNA polymerase sigma factor [Acetobacteraceae bacterium]
MPETVVSPKGTEADGRDARWSRLMAAAQDGDARAYDILLREAVPLLRAVCRRRLAGGTGDEVEDAVQDALLTIHRVRHTYDPARPLRPWLAAIAERRALDHGRRLGRAAARHAALGDAAELASPAPGADAVLGGRRAGERLRRAVDELPAAQRTALHLTKLAELDLAEASRRSGMSVGALKVATHRALRALRRRFGVEE